MISHEERIILEHLQLNQTSQDCYKPDELAACFTTNLKTSEEVADICVALSNKKLITMQNYVPSNKKLSSCYSISEKGIDELNPSSRSKNLYKFALLGTIFAGIAAIASIISIFT